MDEHKSINVNEIFCSKILSNSSNFKLLWYLLIVFTPTKRDAMDDTSPTTLSI